MQLIFKLDVVRFNEIIAYKHYICVTCTSVRQLSVPWFDLATLQLFVCTRSSWFTCVLILVQVISGSAAAVGLTYMDTALYLEHGSH